MTILAFRRVAIAAGLLAAAAILSGCSSGGFDIDKLDVFGLSDKPKLPGERKPVFPEGVPGVTQGIPPDLIKGNNPQADTLNSQTAAAPVAPVAVAEPEPAQKPKAKPRPKPRTTARTAPARQPAAEPKETKQERAAQQPGASQTSASQKSAGSAQSPWPSSTPQATGASAPWPSNPNTTTAPWPSAPPPGTFSR